MGEEYRMFHAFNRYTFDQDPNHFDKMQRQAIQIAAMAVAMLECIDRVTEKRHRS